jgi:hypothetical protein
MNQQSLSTSRVKATSLISISLLMFSGICLFTIEFCLFDSTHIELGYKLDAVVVGFDGFWQNIASLRIKESP